MTERLRLSTRRNALTFCLLFQGSHPITVTTSLASGCATEVFISTPKTGTALADAAHDAAILISIALQHGIRVAALAHSVKRDDDGRPASLVGLVLDALLALEVECSK
jgi:hypothetical protein